MSDALREIEAAFDLALSGTWDAHYGKGLSAEYARIVARAIGKGRLAARAQEDRIRDLVSANLKLAVSKIQPEESLPPWLGHEYVHWEAFQGCHVADSIGRRCGMPMAAHGPRPAEPAEPKHAPVRDVRERVLDWFRAYAHEPSDKPTGYWVEFGADDSPEIQSLVALVHDTQHCDCGAKAIREAESLREQLAGVTATRPWRLE